MDNQKDKSSFVETSKDKLKQLEISLQKPDFWVDKNKAQVVLKEIREIKAKLSSVNKYDKGDAVIGIYSGAGGEDAEDWARILFEMYEKFVSRKKWSAKILHEHRNDTNGLKNITFEVSGKGVYGELKGETGVHRLVRKSPFSSKNLRHTSFALVEALPRFIEKEEIEIKPEDLEVSFAKSSGPGGQNVNKRETAVRIKHKPTGISVHIDSERLQERNRDRATELLRSKLFVLYKKNKKEEIDELKLSDKSEPEWGNQIRSYVLHPYKMVKDHRTEIETSDVDGVFEGKIEEFIEAEKDL